MGESIFYGCSIGSREKFVFSKLPLVYAQQSKNSIMLSRCCMTPTIRGM